MRDSFHDDRLLDRVMRERFQLMLIACRDMSADAVWAYIGDMRPAILREYRARLAKDPRWLASRQPLRAVRDEPSAIDWARSGFAAPMTSAG